MLEQRRTKRFELQLPVTVMRAGSEKIAQPGETRNVSAKGVLFTSAAEMRPGPIEYIITLGQNPQRRVRLRCMGQVVRSERTFDSFAVAATLERYEFQRE